MQNETAACNPQQGLSAVHESSAPSLFHLMIFGDAWAPTTQGISAPVMPAQPVANVDPRKRLNPLQTDRSDRYSSAGKHVPAPSGSGTRKGDPLMNAVSDLSRNQPPPKNHRYRILLADDELDLWWTRNIDALTAAGYEVGTANNGEAAWEALSGGSWDLLITDNKMPLLWGVDLIRRLRENDISLPVILASTLLPEALRRDQPECLDQICLLEKPVSAPSLVGAVAGCLAPHQ